MIETDPCNLACITVPDEVNTLVPVRSRRIARAMAGKPRKDEPSVQLVRLKYLILQLIREPHSDWKDEYGSQLTSVKRAEVARRIGLTETHANAICNPETRRNMDVGASILARVSDRVGLDVRYFYDGYTGERPYKLYLLAHKREQKHLDENVKTTVNTAVQSTEARLRAEMLALFAGIRVDIDQAKQAQAAAEEELARVKAHATELQRERDQVLRKLADSKKIARSRR
jgi:hypothetical protein